jgi:hypothetical protein
MWNAIKALCKSLIKEVRGNALWDGIKFLVFLASTLLWSLAGKSIWTRICLSLVIAWSLIYILWWAVNWRKESLVTPPKRTSKRRHVVIAIASVSFAAFLLFVSKDWIRDKSSIPKEPRPPTIHDLFLADFPHFSANFKAEVLPSDGETDKHPKAEVEIRIWHDLTSRTKIIGLYVPITLNTFDIIRIFPAFKEELLNHKVQSITAPKDPQDVTRMSILVRDNEFLGVTFKLPNDMGSIDPFKFPFHGTVYVYYSFDLTISQLGELETLFKRGGFTPIFRGEHYVQGRWRDMKATGHYIDLPVDTKARTVEFGKQ